MPDTKKPSVPSYINEYYAWDESLILPPTEKAKFEAAQAEHMKAYSPGFVDKYGGVNLPMAPRLRPPVPKAVSSNRNKLLEEQAQRTADRQRMIAIKNVVPAVTETVK